MTALLDIVADSRALLLDATAAYAKALRNARASGHTLEEIGRAASITKQSVSKALKRDREETP